MTEQNGPRALSSDDIEAKIQRQPHLYLRLIQNSLTVAESLRQNYFKNTAESSVFYAGRYVLLAMHSLPVPM